MTILDGKRTAEKLYSNLPKVNACLIIITVGDDPASKVYVKNKLKACEKVGITAKHLKVSESIQTNEFIRFVKDEENDIHKNFNGHGGIILQLPAPRRLENAFNELIKSRFDVDGFGAFNVSYMVSQSRKDFIKTLPVSEQKIISHLPATPKGIMTLLKEYDISIEGKHVVIVGRSEIVGKPLARLMLDANATVTICHSKTKNLENITKIADILVVAIGKPKFINETHINPKTIIIDVGINRDDNGKLCGDVDFESIKDKCAAITPVPGGVGPMTVYSLIENVVEASINNEK